MPQETAETTAPAQAPAAVMARGISMSGPWGRVLGPLDLDVQAGGVTAVTGPAGSGRVALLMCLAGRMKPTQGSLTVFGKTRAQDIFAESALAGVEQLDSIYESVTVRDLLTEQTRWDARWYRLIGRAGEPELERLCRPVFGELPLPGLTAFVEELDELDGLLLRIALSNTARPPLLVVGSIDQVTNDRDRETLIGRLVALGEQQTVITATANEIAAELGVREQIPVDRAASAEAAGHGRHEKGEG